MALVAMAVYDLAGAGRSQLTRRTLESLARTVDWSRHRLFVIDNGSTDPETIKVLAHLESGSCQAAQEVGGVIYMAWPPRQLSGVTVIRNGTNLGTARAINKAWAQRKPGEMCCKMDNDVEFHESGWLDLMEQCFPRYHKDYVALREPVECPACRRPVPCQSIACDRGRHAPVESEPWVRDWHPLGILALKRKDLGESPWHPNAEDFRTRIAMLPQLNAGDRWAFVEKVRLPLGTVQMYSPDLLDKIGYLAQMGVYGFDDSLASVRAAVAGFDCCFLPQINLDHIDGGNSEYTTWKQKYAGGVIDRYFVVANEIVSGKRSVWCGPDEDLA